MPDFSRDNKRSFTKIKNRSGPRTVPCGTQVVTGLEEEKVLLHLIIILVSKTKVGFKPGMVFVSHTIGTKFIEQKVMIQDIETFSHVQQAVSY